MPHRGENKRNSTLRCTKTGGIQPKLNVACFVQSCLTDADFVIFSNYCLIGTRPRPRSFSRRVQLPFSVSRSSTRRAKASMEQSSTVSPGWITRSKKQLGISRLHSSFSMHREHSFPKKQESRTERSGIEVCTT